MRWVIASILITFGAFAQSTQLSLPLQGYYRVGQYMPVRVSGATGEIVLSAAGAVPTRIARSPNSEEAVAPLLIMTANATEVTAHIGAETVKTGPLRPLEVNERIVGVTEGNEAFARALFPGKKVITVPIDAQFPSPTSPMAFEALDGIVLDQLSPTQVPWVEQFLASGTTVAVKTGQATRGDWNWEKRGDYWVLAYPIVGPAGAEIDLDNYSPSYGLEPEESLAMRQLVVIGGALFALLVIAAVLLLRAKSSIAVIASLSIATAVIALAGSRRSEATKVYDTTIETFSGKVQQVDNWRYVRSWRQPVRYTERAGSLIYPMLASESQIQSLGLELHCEYDGAPRTMTLNLPPHSTIAWLQRGMHSPVERPQLAPGINTPFTPILNEKYLSSNVKELGRELYGDGTVLEVK